MFSWKPTRANVSDNQNLPWMWIECKLSHMHNCFKLFTLNGQNINSLLVAMEPQKKLDFGTFHFEWQALQWTLPIW
jgi:hypothetical protein